MRLTGSFHTMVTQGVSGTASSRTSGRSTSAGATLTGAHLPAWLSPSLSARAGRRCQAARPAPGGRCIQYIRPGQSCAAGRATSAESARRRHPWAATVVLLLVTANSSTALLTDRYELTMLTAALGSGAAGRRAVFEVFARALPHGRRYGVVAGTGRFLEALEQFTFGPGELAFLRDGGIVDERALRYLESY